MAHSGVYALNSTNGEILWSYLINSPNDHFRTNPVISGNLLFVVATTSAYPTFSNLVTAFDIETGGKVWEQVVPGQTGINPAVYNNVLIFGSSNGKVYALNQANGSLAWVRDFSVSYNNDGADYTSPVIYNNLVIVHSGNSGFYGLNALTGATVWHYPDAVMGVSSPAIGEGKVFISIDRYQEPTKTVALNAATGALVWEYVGLNSLYQEAPLFVKDRLYLYSGTRGIDLIDASSGKYIKTVLSGASIAPPTLVENGTAYYFAESGMVQ